MEGREMEQWREERRREGRGGEGKGGREGKGERRGEVEGGKKEDKGKHCRHCCVSLSLFGLDVNKLKNKPRFLWPKSSLVYALLQKQPFQILPDGATFNSCLLL